MRRDAKMGEIGSLFVVPVYTLAEGNEVLNFINRVILSVPETVLQFCYKVA